MTSISSELRKCMEQKIMLAYLLQLNRYALQKGVITQEAYREMERSMIQTYGMNPT